MNWITTEKIILLTFFGNKTALLGRVLETYFGCPNSIQAMKNLTLLL
ncbi:hypothetical protein [Peribacillus frigoritolerans]|nr:hypothetical protein [Peribacillus frigoritolerans]MCY8939693.1 hypothetical protein [Peribacillus frigoritolerans]